MKITANSLSAQIDQLNRAFQAVEATGKKFETLERKASAILYSALHQVYDFGENLLALKSQPGTNIIREFFLNNDVAYNSKTQANPYIGLVKLAFRAGNASSHSQYATVLGYAASLQIAAADFPAWLNERKIEGWRTAALDAQNSNARNIRNQGRLTKVQNAVAVMDAKPASALVSLPAGVQAPEGYALVLARIDANNGAQIVEVVHSSAEKVEPILLGLVDGPTAVSTEPLAPFFRAIDLIINTTPDATMGNQRDLLVRNLTKRGKQTTQIEAILRSLQLPRRINDVGRACR